MKLDILASKRNQTYLAFLIFAAFGVCVDWFFWRHTLPSFTLNDLIQMVGTIFFCRTWQEFDARDLAVSRSGTSRILTLLLTPVGLGVYLFQTRHWLAATGAFFSFWLGYVVAVISAFYFVNYVWDPLFGTGT
ncbi:MAG: hypothetical protein ACK4ZW_10780 [Blastomonas sp.]